MPVVWVQSRKEQQQAKESFAAVVQSSAMPDRQMLPFSNSAGSASRRENVDFSKDSTTNALILQSWSAPVSPGSR